MPTHETQFIHTADGRKLAYCEYGDPRGKPVFYFHGTPGSRLEPVFGDEAGREYGFRLIAPDRPGIGQSDYAENRKLLDWPLDVAAAADQLGIGHFGVIGVSGGGPYALACSRVLAERLDFCVLMGSWAPVAEEPALWELMAPLDRFFGRLLRSAPRAFHLPFSLLGASARWLSPRGFIRSLDSSLSEPDRHLLEEEALAEFFREDIVEAFRQGVRGPADDAIILQRDWGFSTADISMEIDLYHGKKDHFAPFAFAEYLSARLPAANLHPYPDAGHLFVMKLFGTVFRDILERA